MQVAQYPESSEECSVVQFGWSFSIHIEGGYQRKIWQRRYVGSDHKGLEFHTKKFRPDSIGNHQPLKGLKQMDLGRCKIRIGSRKISQKTLLLSKNLQQLSTWDEMGAVIRAVTVRWEERRKQIRKYCGRNERSQSSFRSKKEEQIKALLQIKGTVVISSTKRGTIGGESRLCIDSRFQVLPVIICILMSSRLLNVRVQSSWTEIVIGDHM